MKKFVDIVYKVFTFPVRKYAKQLEAETEELTERITTSIERTRVQTIKMDKQLKQFEAGESEREKRMAAEVGKLVDESIDQLKKSTQPVQHMEDLFLQMRKGEVSPEHVFREMQRLQLVGAGHAIPQFQNLFDVSNSKEWQQLQAKQAETIQNVGGDLENWRQDQLKALEQVVIPQSEMDQYKHLTDEFEVWKKKQKRHLPEE